MKITIKWLKGKRACSEAIRDFSAYADSKDGNDTDSIIVLKTLIKKDKLDWANWLVTRLMTHKQKISYAIYAAEQVVGLFEAKYPNDKRPRQAIEAAKAVLKHNTKLNRSAANAAYAAANAAAYAAYAAAYEAASAAAYAAYAAANAAAYAAYAAAYAAYAAANAAMKIKIIRYGIKLLRRAK